MNIKTITVILILTIAGQCLGQTTGNSFPESAGGKRGQAFMNLLESKEDAAVRSFVINEMAASTTISTDERISSFKRTREFLSDSKLRRILTITDTDVSFIIKTTRGSFAKVRMDLDPDNEKRITSIGVERVSEESLSEKPAERIAEAELVSTVEAYLKDLDEKDEFSGTVLVAKKGKPVFQKAYGLADKDQKRPNKIDTKFNLGSINKLFTMLAIGLLADEGKLSFSDTIGKHLKDYANKKAREKVTIEHLLTMSSGIGDIFGDEYEATPKTKLRTINSYLPLFASKPLAFEPGTDRQYSNGGFLVLGAIIEKVSGQTYYDFVRERIFKPMGMKDTESYVSDERVENIAEGYLLSNGKRVNNFSTRPARGSSGGGGYSTAPDMLKFSNALESGEFKTPNSLRESKDQILNGLSGGILRFGGGAPGINSTILNNLGNGYTVIVLSNYDPPAASNIGSKIRRWID